MDKDLEIGILKKRIEELEMRLEFMEMAVEACREDHKRREPHTIKMCVVCQALEDLDDEN